MARIPLITSLPPCMSRRESNGVDVAPQWRDHCVQSWVRQGFQPVTVNSDKEEIQDFELLSAFEQLKVDKDGFEEYGKRYVALSEMIARVVPEYDGPIAITNSDIALDLTDAAKARVVTLQPGSCIVCNRLDVETPDLANAVRYPTGFDFFVFHSDDLKRMSANGMYFGLPWWDHFLPVNMISQGVRRLPSDGIMAYHLNHGGRWKRRVWRRLGWRFIRDMRAMGAAGDTTFLTALGAAAKRKRQSKKSAIFRLLPAFMKRTDFYSVADLNVAYIDQALDQNAR